MLGFQPNRQWRIILFMTRNDGACVCATVSTGGRQVALSPRTFRRIAARSMATVTCSAGAEPSLAQTLVIPKLLTSWAERDAESWQRPAESVERYRAAVSRGLPMRRSRHSLRAG